MARLEPQGQLSLSPEDPTPTQPRQRRPHAPRFVNVRRDPDVINSVVRRDKLGADMTSAFANFWAHLSPERRAELFAKVAA